MEVEPQRQRAGTCCHCFSKPDFKDPKFLLLSLIALLDAVLLIFAVANNVELTRNLDRCPDDLLDLPDTELGANNNNNVCCRGGACVNTSDPCIWDMSDCIQYPFLAPDVPDCTNIILDSAFWPWVGPLIAAGLMLLSVSMLRHTGTCGHCCHCCGWLYTPTAFFSFGAAILLLFLVEFFVRDTDPCGYDLNGDGLGVPRSVLLTMQTLGAILAVITGVHYLMRFRSARKGRKESIESRKNRAAGRSQ